MMRHFTLAKLSMTIIITFTYSLGCGNGENTSGTDLDVDSDSNSDGDTDGDSDGDTDSDSDTDSEHENDTFHNTELIWVEIPGGTYMMGSEEFSRAQPVHEVTVPTFEVTKTEVTVGQYRQCVNAGICEWPYSDVEEELNCHYFTNNREIFPMNCISWNLASAFCAWARGRLPTEAEWEYAARSGGKDVSYSWGNDTASCDLAVIADYELDEPSESDWGCKTGWALPVCSRPLGNTDQGLCDMTGNLWELVEDWFHESYDGAPDDGTAFNSPPTDSKMKRGGDFTQKITSSSSDLLHVSYRASSGGVNLKGETYGFRCVR